MANLSRESLANQVRNSINPVAVTTKIVKGIKNIDT